MRSQKSDATRRLRRVIMPLRPEEERRAQDAVTAYLTGEAGAEARFRILSVELRIDKPAHPEVRPVRLIRVLAVDYQHRRELDMTVNTRGKLVEVANYPGTQLAYNNDEVQEARAIAESDEQVPRVAQQHGAFISPFVPMKDAEQRNRLIGLHYVAARPGELVQFLGSAVVDMTERRLVSFVATQAEGR